MHESTFAPTGLDGKRPNPDRWLVIAPSRMAVFLKRREIRQWAQERRKRALQAKTQQAEAREIDERRGSPATPGQRLRESSSEASDRQTSSSEASDRQTSSSPEPINSESEGDAIEPWDVTGHYEVTEATSLGAWHRRWTGFIDVKVAKTAIGLLQLYATFELGYHTGVLGFVKASSKGRPEDETQFLIPPDEMPAPELRRWSYRWRGEENGEGVIELTADHYLCPISFYGPRGKEIRGTIECDGEAGGSFVGHKTHADYSYGYPSEVQEEWSRRSEEAYELARISRWRNRW